MKIVLFHSIHTRIMAATTLLIMSIVGIMVSLWVTSEINERKQEQEQARLQALVLATAVANSLTNKLAIKSWSSLRLGLNVFMEGNPDLVYILVTDASLFDQIVAASPPQFQEQFIPDIVPVEITKNATHSHKEPLIADTVILKDVEFPRGKFRAYRGDLVMEIATDIRLGEAERLGTFRIGISLNSLEQTIKDVMIKALMVGVAGWAFGLMGAYILARQFSQPVQQLQLSAAKIAAGDFCHRADIHLSDEIGALAESFNEMSTNLQRSFSRLEKTVEAFQRFVPEKFLRVIASEGIENIQVGVASTKVMTILFADIRNYTSMSEHLTPIQTYLFLNDYLASMGEAISGAGGFIDKYIGDAIMALFDDEATDGVLGAAMAMRGALLKFNENQWHKGLPAIDIGIGIHRGEVVMGTVGFTSRMESTVIGDTVNVASRVEGLTKMYHRSILVTEAVVAAVRCPEAFGLSLVDPCVKVKGKDEGIAIYELQMPPSQDCIDVA